MLSKIKFLNKFLISIFLLITAICNAKEEVLFAVNNNPVTTIDLTQRVKYLSLLNDLDANNTNINKYIDDLIAIKLFDEFAIRRKLNIKEEEIENYFNKIFIKNKIKLDDLIKKKELNKKIILKNIRYDLQRKRIIEYFLDDRIKQINLKYKNNNIIDIYNIKLNYFIISNKHKDETKNIYNNLLKKDFNSIKEYLKNSNIEYDFSSKEIVSLDRINNKIKNIILSNKETFFIDEGSYLMTGIIEKKLKTDIDLKYSFFQIIPKKNAIFDDDSYELISCNNIEDKKSDNRLEIKEFISVHLKELNIDIFKNFSKENEKLIIKNDNQKFIILLCKIDYDKKILKNKLFDNKIQKIASEIEIEFVQTYKKEFKFQIFN